MINFLKRLFCKHQYTLISWGDTDIVDKGIHQYYINEVRVGCPKCGKIKNWERDFQANRLSIQEMRFIFTRLTGQHLQPTPTIHADSPSDLPPAQ